MNSFTEGLHLELKSSGSPVKVQALCPGFTISEFHDVMQMDRKLIPSWLWMSAEEVVDASVRALAKDQPLVVPGGIYKLIVLVMKLTGLVPRSWRMALSIRYARRKRRP